MSYFSVVGELDVMSLLHKGRIVRPGEMIKPGERRPNGWFKEFVYILIVTRISIARFRIISDFLSVNCVLCLLVALYVEVNTV